MIETYQVTNITMKKGLAIQEVLALKLQALYFSEHEVLKALPKMEKAAESKELKEAFAHHLEETKEQIKKLEQSFEILNLKPKKLASEGIKGIISDGSFMMKQKAESNLKDSMIAGAARYVEHYEMAGYIGAIEEAKNAGFSDIASLMKANLREEMEADSKLAALIKENLAVG